MEAHRERLLRRGDYIWGSWVKPESVDGYIVGVNPGDRSDVLGRFSFSEASVDDAVACAQRGYLLWRRIRQGDRAKAMRRYRDVLHKRQDQFAGLITRETGKPWWEARQEVLASIRAVDLLLEDGLSLLEARVLNERDARSDYRARGVVGIVIPYSLPLLTPTLHAVAAILAGNTVVLKPSKFTPGVGQAVGEAMDRCKLPRGVFNLVQGSGQAVGHKLATHPGIDALMFSGSHDTGVQIAKAVAERPELPMFLQCGGKGASIVLDGCDMDRAVYEVLVGAFLTSGQRHNSTGRVIVTDDVHDWFLNELTRRVRGVRVGYGFDPDTFLGPLISENFRTRYARYGRAIHDSGHQCLIQAKSREVQGRKGFYVQPAVYSIDWNKGPAFVNDEPPGPTLLVYKVASWEDAVALHNRLVYRVSTSVFADPEFAELDELTERLRTGALNLNRGTIGSSLRLPSAGLGRSSNGLPGGIDLLRFLSTPRSTLVDNRPFQDSQLVPGIRWGDEDRSEAPTELIEDGVDASPTVGMDVEMEPGGAPPADV